MSAPSSNLVRTYRSGNNGPVESRPDLATVRRLQHVRGFPAVSILLSTSPAARLTETDAAALEQVVARTLARVRAEVRHSAGDLHHQLRSLADWASTTPTDHALALYAHAAHREVVRLPTPVRNRAVVAETFATGDIVAAFRHAPHYLLLLLGGASPRLFDGHGERLEERNPGASVADAAHQRPHLRHIDAAIDAIDPCGVAPLVLAGDPSLSALFLQVTTHPERVVGRVRCDALGTGLDTIARLAGRFMAGHRARLEQESVAALGPAHQLGRVAAGISDVWPAVIRGEGEKLLVEERMTWPARISGDGLGLRPAAPDGGRGVVADVIGELAWAVTFYGGEFIVVPAGTLNAFDGIALILRSPRAENELVNG